MIFTLVRLLWSESVWWCDVPTTPMVCFQTHLILQNLCVFLSKWHHHKCSWRTHLHTTHHKVSHFFCVPGCSPPTCALWKLMIMMPSAKRHIQVTFLPEPVQTRVWLGSDLTPRHTGCFGVCPGLHFLVHKNTFTLPIFYANHACFQTKLPVWKAPKGPLAFSVFSKTLASIPDTRIWVSGWHNIHLSLRNS